jgi:hypothetical protein
MNRRSFLGGAFAFAAARRVVVRAAPRIEVPVALIPSRPRLRHELVNIAVPFPRDLLDDASRLRVLDERGREIDAAVRALEAWRTPPGDRVAPRRSIRAVQVQFPFAASGTSRRVTVTVGHRRSSSGTRIVPVSETEEVADSDARPRGIALLPADWLCASQIVGPQRPARLSGALAPYDQLVARSFPGSLPYLDSDVYHHWLFDRTSAYYCQYVRTGDRRFFEAAYHAAHFMRRHTALAGPDAGMFTLKGPDVKYVYPRAMHVHYLLTGDDRARAAATVMARYCLTRWDPIYRPDAYEEPPLGVDPEKDRPFWSTRHEAYGLLGVLHGWELTGDEIYWQRIREYVDALASHQDHPPDGRPGDGSWRQDWALYDPNETRLAGGASAWMTAILLSALFHAWLVTRDARIPAMVTRWCDFLDRKGFIGDGAKVHYVIDCFGSDHLDDAPGEQEQGMERHSTELAYTFAMGLFFSRDAAQRRRFRRRFDRLFASALRIDANRPARCYNWAFQASSQISYFLNAAERGIDAPAVQSRSAK